MDTLAAMELSDLKRRFEAVYRRPAEGAVRAPGRVNLIGEHTDYNGGFVMPIAIERETMILYARRADGKIVFSSGRADAPVTIDAAGPIVPGQPQWANYCKGVAAGLSAAGVTLAGADLLIESDVPLGGGLSSSASLEVATALALLEAAGARGAIEPRALALLCQKAENEFAGAPCGIMDQSIAILGQAGHALLLDCRDGATRQLPFDDPRLVLLVADTQVKHDLADGGYGARRNQCHAAARKLGVQTLREASLGMLIASDLEGKERMRASHVLGEIARTLQAAEALGAGDYRRFGRLMVESHESLRKDYEVSCEELDAVVALARAYPGVYGARMTGGGFGGCAIVLAEAAGAEAIKEHIASGFAARFGRRCPIFATRAAGGASVLA